MINMTDSCVIILSIFLQTQLVCDHKLRIRDICVGYPGSVHDSRVFRVSPLSQSLQEKCGELYIVGDSGYPLLPNLLTPFRDRGQLNQAQGNYNIKLSKNRILIEHCNGLLKQKFRQLYHIKLRKMINIVHFIRACCVLHNLAIMDDFNIVENNAEDPEVIPPVHEQNIEFEERDDRQGLAVRERVVNLLNPR